MNLQEAVKCKVLNLCKERNIPINKLSILSGLYQSTVNSLINGASQNPKLLTILRICEGLDIELKDFFSDKIFSDLDDE